MKHFFQYSSNVFHMIKETGMDVHMDLQFIPTLSSLPLMRLEYGTHVILIKTYYICDS